MFKEIPTLSVLGNGSLRRTTLPPMTLIRLWDDVLVYSAGPDTDPPHSHALPHKWLAELLILVTFYSSSQDPKLDSALRLSKHQNSEQTLLIALSWKSLIGKDILGSTVYSSHLLIPLGHTCFFRAWFMPLHRRKPIFCLTFDLFAHLMVWAFSLLQ